MRAYLGLRGFTIAVSRTFERLEKMIPALISEMRNDVVKSPFTREIIAFSKGWSYGGGVRSYFTLYFEEHDDLLSKLRIMENYGALIDIKYNDIDRYELTEDFVEYLLLPV
ncbi:MAG: hypothetical protein B7Y31_04805 [Novosphingobium sp. 16-62-11]|nr:MAG: hypothetical protein B7Y31_04805 [Novosphingobium sp. 16-62-11]OZA20218.1 MAG: hypothetical protein B7X90_06535 [Novosphingobium sp. 17-62-19]OZA62608.1 MAG: hypothetical protein B7X78_06200 [Sphingomonadales bacterium 39-62-4]